MTVFGFLEEIGLLGGDRSEEELGGNKNEDKTWILMLTGLSEDTAVLVTLVMMLLLLVFGFVIFFVCTRQWRFRSLPSRSKSVLPSIAPSSSRSIPVATATTDMMQLNDLETPLFYENLGHVPGENSSLYSKIVSEESSFQTSRRTNSPRRHALAGKQKHVPTDLHANQDVCVVVDVDHDASEDLVVGQTLKRSSPAFKDQLSKEAKHARKEEDQVREHLDDAGRQRITIKDVVPQGSCLNLEVISGPSRGVNFSQTSTSTSKPQVTLGRLSPSDISLLKDSEVSGKHALISWNSNISKWELVDMGSLNGTFLNSQAIHSDSGHRRWSEPSELVNGDTITLGTSSKISVQILPFSPIPFGVGMASDPMALRRGGKKLPMEDMYYYQWPLPGVDRFGVFGIFDGHGGAGAAKTASKLLPEIVAHILSNPETKYRVISNCDATEVLKDAFLQMEAAMNHQFEGCTATMLLVWADNSNNFFAQCANVGDSACVMNIGGATINMTEDHRIVSPSERTRLKEAGLVLKDGETRLCGLNLARMLGDKFLKEQEPRFSSEPFVSQVAQLKRTGMEFALLASDGLWDVISSKKAVRLVLQMKEKKSIIDREKLVAEDIANFLLNEARNLRTKDNTSILFLDFDTIFHEELRKSLEETNNVVAEITKVHHSQCMLILMASM